MLSDTDNENIEKAAQSAALLVSDIQALYGSEDPLLTEVALGLLETAVALRSKLDRICPSNRSPKRAPRQF